MMPVDWLFVLFAILGTAVILCDVPQKISAYYYAKWRRYLPHVYRLDVTGPHRYHGMGYRVEVEASRPLTDYEIRQIKQHPVVYTVPNCAGGFVRVLD